VSKYLSIAEIAELADIPNSSCRRYLADFEVFFMVKGGSRVKKYEAAAVDILKRIKQLYDDGMGTTEIHSVLVNEFPLVVDSEKQERKEEAAAHVPGLATSEDIAEIKQALEQQKQFNEMLVKKLDEQNAYIKKSIERRDQQLMESLRATLEERKAIAMQEAAATAEQKKKGFWAKLFRIE
jgi:DNA-binding transcriptional MerR regulator